MFGRHETIGLQKAATLVAGVIGLACCILAVLDARSQQTEDPPAPVPAAVATGQATHHMRGWSAHKDNAAHPTPPVYAPPAGVG